MADRFKDRERWGRRYRDEYDEGSPYRRDAEWGKNYDESRYGRWSSYNRPWRSDYDREGYSGTAYNRGDYGIVRRQAYGEPMGRSYGGSAYDRPRRRADIWWEPGPYSGLGPRGYVRSSESITKDVYERLTHDGRLDARAINVRVEAGEVLLQGVVNSRQAKRLAEDIAESVPGVRDVHNQLRISRSGVVQSNPAQVDNRWQRRIREGMEVVGSDRNNIGRVKEARETDFLVDRPLARDVYVPYEACREISGNQVVIRVPTDEVNDQGWANPALTEVPGERVGD